MERTFIWGMEAICNFTGILEHDVVLNLRFRKHDVAFLADIIPSECLNSSGNIQTRRKSYVSSKKEAICNFLRNLASPSSVQYLEIYIIRTNASIFETFYEYLEAFYKWASPFLLDFQTDFIRRRAAIVSAAIAKTSMNSLSKWVGFIDGTLIEISRRAG
jgi:hypothetical protein